MGRLREAAAFKKNVMAHVHTGLLKQVDILQKSLSLRTGEEGAWAPPSPQRDGEAAHTTSSLKRNMLETHDDNELSENSKRPQSPLALRILWIWFKSGSIK